MKKQYIVPTASFVRIGSVTDILTNKDLIGGSEGGIVPHMLGNERKDMDPGFDFTPDDANQVDWDF